MTAIQEEALYDFLDNTAGAFELYDAVSYIRRIEPKRINRLALEVEAFIGLKKLAFPAGRRQWMSRRAFFGSLPFVISPTRLELLNGILIPGHRCVPFANSSLMPQEYTFYWEGSSVPFTTTEGSPEEFYPYYSIFGEEYAPQYVARDNAENEEAFNNDPYDDPPEVSIKTLDMRNIYREAAFVPGDRFVVRTLDWKTGGFELKKAGRDEWDSAELEAWAVAAEEGFEKSFEMLGPGSSTEEQIAFAYWYGGPAMKNVPAYALEDFLYKKTERIESAAYGIETRFWYAGREIPDREDLDPGNVRPDETPVEAVLHKLKIPVSEFVIQSYVRDALFRGEKNSMQALVRLVPSSVESDDRDMQLLSEYTEEVLKEFRKFYSPFTDKAMGSIRLRAGELHTAVIDLAARLCKGDINTSWLPRHTFIILSQIQNHTASVMEDLDSDEPPQEMELEALDNSLDSMIETYEDIKELIDEALDSYRRNKLALIRAGSASGTVTERLVQLSISGIDVWRRLILPESFTLAELHKIIQLVFGWHNSFNYRFIKEKFAEESGFSGIREMDLNTPIQAMEAQSNIELFYEYGSKWIVRIMILSREETPVTRPVRCVAGAGTAPPEFIDGPVKFKKVLYALESGNDMERLDARQKLGTEFMPGEFDLDACNRNLNAGYTAKSRGGPPEK